VTAMHKEAGLDWLTATTKDPEVCDRMDLAHDFMRGEEGITRNMLKHSAWQGYDGVRGQHFFYGSKDNERLILLSGSYAAQYGVDMLEAGARPSRLDLQLTGIPALLPSVVIENMFHQALNHKGKNGHPPDLKMFTGRHGPEGLYVGRRASQIMLRCYDKGLESGQSYYRGHLRCEVELKQESAQAHANAILSWRGDDDPIAALIAQLYADRGITVPFEIGRGVSVARPVVRETSIEAKAAYLRTQISPLVQRMCEEVGYQAVIELLCPGRIDWTNFREDDILWK
jgi:DNA relaxase NicK